MKLSKAKHLQKQFKIQIINQKMSIAIFMITIAVLVLHTTDAYLSKHHTPTAKLWNKNIQLLPKQINVGSRNHQKIINTAGPLHSTMFPVDQPEKSSSDYVFNFETIADFTLFCFVSSFMIIQYMVYSISLVDNVFN